MLGQRAAFLKLATTTSTTTRRVSEQINPHIVLTNITHQQHQLQQQRYQHRQLQATSSTSFGNCSTGQGQGRGRGSHPQASSSSGSKSSHSTTIDGIFSTTTKRDTTSWTKHLQPIRKRSDSNALYCGIIRCRSFPLSEAVPRRKKSSSAALVEKEHDQESIRRGSSTGGGSLKTFRLTDIGEGIKEVEILRWFVSPGERVRQFDRICEVQSDKANVDITSRYDGIVRKVHWDVGDMVQTGAVLVEIEETASSAAIPGSTRSSVANEASLPSMDEPRVPKPSFPPATASESPSAPPAPLQQKPPENGGAAGATGGADVTSWAGFSGSSRGKQALATPAVRRLCRELSIDPSSLAMENKGTGAGGRVLKGDVLAYAAVAGREGSSDEIAMVELGDLTEAPRDASKATHHIGVLSDPGETAATREHRGEYAERQEEERRCSIVQDARGSISVPIKGVQRAMMDAMQKALEVPHMTFCDEVNVDPLKVLRSSLTEAAECRGVRLSYMPLIVKATSMALTAFPSLNASLSQDKSSLLMHRHHNIGVAMDTEKGLLVPCIKAVQDRSVLDIAEELNALQRLGAEGKLGEQELSGTTFTLSNIGSIGGTYASPVTLYPQVCIGAIGRIQRVPRFESDHSDRVVAARVFPVSWAADHRVIDGGTLARFSNMWKAYLENPIRMLADTR